MSFIITEHTRQTIAQSLAEVSQHQIQLARTMAKSLREPGREIAEVEQSADLLVDMMISQAHSLVAQRKWLGLDHEQLVLVSHEIGARDFTPFGDRLADVLSSVVPPCREPSVASAWCDVFWAIVLSLPTLHSERDARAATRPAALA